jgi:DNA-3-methyladenine glycosylase II
MSARDHQLQLKAAVAHLAAHDPIMAKAITAMGLPTFTPHADYYRELVGSIISQQLSIKAAATIEKRFLALFDGVPGPQQILAKSVDELRAVGMSNAKATYVRDLATHVQQGTLHINRLPDLNNQEIIKELTAVKGIGEWTAHMFMIFALGRLDVLPVGDLGFKNGVKKLYNLPAVPTPKEVTAIAKKNHWHPYESVATWYAWQSLN